MERIIKVVKTNTYDRYLKHVMPLVVVILASSFCLYEFILQVSASVITTDLMRELSVDASGLGIVVAFYYYAYTPMQIPAGLLFDRYGPRILITIATLICVLGAYFFGYATTPVMSAIGRFLMGAGSAFAFIGALVLVSRWFSPARFALMAGIVQLMTSAGAVLGEAPLAKAVSVYGWRESIIWLAGFGIFLAGVIYLIIRDYAPGQKPIMEDKPKSGISTEWQRLKRVVRNRQSQYVGLYAFFTWGPVLMFAVLWGVPFLTLKYGINEVQAGSMLFFLWLGVGLASPAAGYISNQIESRNKVLTGLAYIGLVTTLLILYVPHIPVPLMLFLLFMFGVAAGAQALSFAVINDFADRELIGTSIGFNNMCVVAGGAVLQPVIGVILVALWDGQIVDGVATYSLAMYERGLVLMPICYAFCAFLSSKCIQETHCQPAYLKGKKYVHMSES